MTAERGDNLKLKKETQGPRSSQEVQNKQRAKAMQESALHAHPTSQAYHEQMSSKQPKSTCWHTFFHTLAAAYSGHSVLLTFFGCLAPLCSLFG